MSKTKKSETAETNEDEIKDAELAETANEKPAKKTVNMRRHVLLIILLVLLIILTVSVFWYLYKNEDKTEKVTTKSCGTLTTADGKTEGLAPYQPVLVGKVNLDDKYGIQYCQWSYNGKDLGRTILAQGECNLKGLYFNKVGTYKVSLKAPFQGDCNNEITLKVTGLSEAEKAIQLKEKTSGVQPEDLQ